MPKKGPNSKAEAANAKKAAAKAEKERAKAAEAEAREAEKWSQGAKGKSKKELEAEKKVRSNCKDSARLQLFSHDIILARLLREQRRKK